MRHVLEIARNITKQYSSDLNHNVDFNASRRICIVHSCWVKSYLYKHCFLSNDMTNYPGIAYLKLGITKLEQNMTLCSFTLNQMAVC